MSYNGTAQEPEWIDTEPSALPLRLSNLWGLTDETRYVFETLHCTSRHVTNSQGIAASAWWRRGNILRALFRHRALVWTDGNQGSDQLDRGCELSLSWVRFHSNMIYRRTKKNGKNSVFLKSLLFSDTDISRSPAEVVYDHDVTLA
jgi:hypothetical protein